MNGITLTTKIVLRSDTAENWRLSNPVLLAGEPGVETDTGRLKLGDGATAWIALAYVQGVTAKLGTGAPTAATSGEPGTLWLDTAAGAAYLNCAEGTANWKRLVLASELASLGAGDMLKSLFATGEKAAQGYVDRAVKADALTVPLTTAAVAEVGSLYFTQQRAQAVAETVFDSRFSTKAVAELADGAQVLTASEGYILNGGDAETT